MAEAHKPLVWLEGEVKTPPFSSEARIEVGYLLRKLQMGESLSLLHSRPLPMIGKNVHELRVNDQNQTWRLIYHLAEDAVVILEVFSKKTNRTPQQVIRICQQRLSYY